VGRLLDCAGVPAPPSVEEAAWEAAAGRGPAPLQEPNHSWSRMLCSVRGIETMRHWTFVPAAKLAGVSRLTDL